MPVVKTNLLDLTRTDLEAFFAELGEPPFRAVQVMKWIYHAGVTDFTAMTNLSKALRARLTEVAEVRPPACSHTLPQERAVQQGGELVVDLLQGAELIPEHDVLGGEVVGCRFRRSPFGLFEVDVPPVHGGQQGVDLFLTENLVGHAGSWLLDDEFLEVNPGDLARCQQAVCSV